MEIKRDLALEERRLRSFINYQNLIRGRSPTAIERILDIGCGAPGFWQLWFQQGVSTWGVDFSRKEHFSPKQSAQATIVYAKERDMWPFTNHFFDAATIIDIPLLYTDPMPLISQTNRLLKKEGVLLVVMSPSSAESDASKTQENKYRKPDYWFGLLGGLGFHRIQMKQYFTYLFPPFTIFQKLFRSVGLPVQEYMIPTPRLKIARRYIFIAQK